MKFLQKTFSSVLLGIFLLTSTLLPFFVGDVKAQSQTWYNQSLPDWYSRVYESPSSDVFGERYTAAQVDWIIWSLLTWLPTKAVGPDFVSCALNPTGTAAVAARPAGKIPEILACVAEKKIFGEVPQNMQDKQLALNNDPGILSLIFQDRPLSGITYIKEISRNWHLIPEAKAQAGFGFDALSPVLALWRASRNAAYGILVIAVLAISFMIMFRVKINPQTVISVQSSIPKIIFALILITFSYAIAGFLVDLMYVVIGLLALLLSSVLSPAVGPGGVFNLLTNGVPVPVDTGVPGAVILITVYLFIISIPLILLAAVIIGVLILATAGTGTVIAVIIGILLFVILATIILFAFRTLWTLFRAFAMIILLTIFAPLQFAIGIVVPSLGFGRWLRSFVSNLSVFVVVGLLLILSYIFLFQGLWALVSTGSATQNYLFDVLKNLPVVGQTISIFIALAQSLGVAAPYNSWPPLLGTGGNTGVCLAMLGASLVSFSIVPKTAELIQSIIEGRPFAYGAAIGEAMTPITAPVGFIAGGVGKGAQDFMGTQTSGFLRKRWASFRNPRGAPVSTPGGAGGRGEGPPSEMASE